MDDGVQILNSYVSSSALPLWVVAYLCRQSRAESKCSVVGFMAIVNVGPVFFFFSCEMFGFPTIIISFSGLLCCPSVCSLARLVHLLASTGIACWDLEPLLCWHFWMASSFSFKTIEYMR